MKQVLSSFSASISEFKKNPTALLNEAEGAPIAILNHNIPTAYLIPLKPMNGSWISLKTQNYLKLSLTAHMKKKMR